jgi:hypothetical protein
VEAIPVPSVATRVAETVPADVVVSAAYRVPKGVTKKQLVGWFKKRVPFGEDRAGGWVWCAAPASSLTKRHPQWNWTRPGSGDEDYDDALVLRLTRQGRSAVRYISVSVGPDFPC